MTRGDEQEDGAEERGTKVDARNRLDEEVFSYRAAKDGRVIFYWHGKAVKTVAGAEAQKFLQRIAGLEGKDAQLVMAKATGNFRHGNERRASRR
jgi:hypothetical protein